MRRAPFGGKMIVLDLRDALHLVGQYVSLRNASADRLLSAAVNEEQTLGWLHTRDVVVKVACEDEKMLGAAVLYVEKGGEVAVFVDARRRGVATALLVDVTEAAREKNMQKLWVWVADDNEPSKKLFEKCGFTFVQKSTKSFDGAEHNGVILAVEIR